MRGTGRGLSEGEKVQEQVSPLLQGVSTNLLRTN